MRIIPTVCCVALLWATTLPASALRVMNPADKKEHPVTNQSVDLGLARIGLFDADYDSGKSGFRKGGVMNGDKFKNTLHLKFLAFGAKIVPAGDMTPNTGHFHLLIDTVLTPEQMKLPIPNDAQHLHYGKGQTEATLTLPTGQHTLQLVLGDGAHKLHQPPVMTSPIVITVE